MNGVRWRVVPPQLGQLCLVNDGQGDGGIDDGVNGGARSDSSPTMVANGAPKSPADGDPFDSNDVETIAEEFRRVRDEYPSYSNVKLARYAERLIVLATRAPWVDDPRLSKGNFVGKWHQEVLARVSFYFPTVLNSMSEPELVLSAANCLIERCDEIIDRSTFFYLFGGCIDALPQSEHVPPIVALLSTMMRHRYLSDAQRLPAHLDPIRKAICGLSPDQFGEVFLSLHEVAQGMSPRDPQREKAGAFLLGVNRLYYAKSGETPA